MPRNNLYDQFMGLGPPIEFLTNHVVHEPCEAAELIRGYVQLCNLVKGLGSCLRFIIVVLHQQAEVVCNRHVVNSLNEPQSAEADVGEL